jgi:hypothetical protein
MKTHVEHSKRTTKSLRTALENLTNCHKDMVAKSMALRTALEEAARVETHKPLKQAVAVCSETIKNLADQRRIKVVERLTDTAVGRLSDLNTETGEMRKLVQSRATNLQKVSTAEKKVAQAKDDRTRDLADGAMQDAQNLFDKTDQDAAEKLCAYEEFRVRELKETLEELTTCLMHMSCRDLEEYTPVLQKLEPINPADAKTEMTRALTGEDSVLS